MMFILILFILFCFNSYSYVYFTHESLWNKCSLLYLLLKAFPISIKVVCIFPINAMLYILEKLLLFTTIYGILFPKYLEINHTKNKSECHL